MKSLQGVAAVDDDGSRQVHSIMQALRGAYNSAARNDAIGQGLHAQDANVMLHQYRQHLFRKAAIVRVHHIQRHLYGIKGKVVSKRRVEHFQMNIGVFMTRKPMYRILPAFFAASRASMVPPGAKTRSGSFM